LGSLAPLSGFFILVAGEAFRILRLIRLEDDRTQNFNHRPVPASPPRVHPVAKEPDSRWAKAFRQEAVKWGLLFTMIVFVITLRDRLAEIFAMASFFMGLLLNALISNHSPNSQD
jgi:hypothetical protein